MADVLFVVKTFLVTFILVVLMQIQIGDRTIESHTQNWIRGSSFVGEMRDVAHGAVSVLNNGYRSSRRFLAAHIKPDMKQEQTAATAGGGGNGFHFTWDKKETSRAEQAINRERIRQLEEDKADENYSNEEPSQDREDSTL